MNSVRRWPRGRHLARASMVPQQGGRLSIVEGGRGLAMVDGAVGGGGEMRGRSLVFEAGDLDRPRVSDDLGRGLLPRSISSISRSGYYCMR